MEIKYVHERHWSIIFILIVSLAGFGIKIKLSSENTFGCAPSFSTLWESLGKIDSISSLNSPMKPSGIGVFLLEWTSFNLLKLKNYLDFLFPLGSCLATVVF